MKLNDLYFSFVGGCKGVEVNTMPQIGDCIASFDTGTAGALFIYTSPHPKFWVAESMSYHEYESTWYLIKKGSFDCQPAVPVSSYGEAVAAANL